MGVESWVREELRNLFPHCFIRQQRLPKGLLVRIVTIDIEQLVHRLPAFARKRDDVLTYALRYVRDAAVEAHNTFDETTEEPRVHVYALFDTADGVTAAKEMCRLSRYRHAKPLPPDAMEQVSRFRIGVEITCPWSVFVGIPAGRRALLDFLSEELDKVSAGALGDGITLHVGNGGPIGEAELKQQAVAVRNARWGVMSDSSDGDLLIALLMAMRLIADRTAGDLPAIIIRSTFYVSPDIKQATGAKRRPAAKPAVAAPPADDAVIVLNDDGDDDFLGPPPPKRRGEPATDDASAPSASSSLLPPSPRVPADSSAAAMQKFFPLYHKQDQDRKAVQRDADGDDSAPVWVVAPPRGFKMGAAVVAAAAAPAGPKRIMEREYVLVHELWRAMIERMGESGPATYSFVALAMGSDLVPGVGNSSGSPIPRIGGKFAWEAWKDVESHFGGLVSQGRPYAREVDADTDDEADEALPAPATQDSPPAPSLCSSAGVSDAPELGIVEMAFDYRVDWNAYATWLRTAYAKKYASKLRFAKGCRGGLVLPTFKELIAATDVIGPAAAAKPLVLDLQWAYQVGLHARYALNYYGMGTLSRDPLAKGIEAGEDDGGSLSGWSGLRNQTLPTLAAEGYDPFSRWGERGCPPTSDLHLAGADAVYGYGAAEIVVDPAPVWMLLHAAEPSGEGSGKRRRRPAKAKGEGEPPAKRKRKPRATESEEEAEACAEDM